MSMNTGAIYAKLKADLSNFKQGINEAKTSVSDLSNTGSRGFDGMNAAQRRVQEQINRVTRSLELAKLKQDSFNDSTSAIQKMGVANQIENYKDKIANLTSKMDGLGNATKQTAFYMQPGYMQTHVIANMIGNVLANAVQNATQKLEQFVLQSSAVATEYEKTMTTLAIVAPKFGVPVEQAQKAAENLGRELRIGTTPAAEGLQNLLKSGLNLDQAGDLLKRFTNEARTGKSANISLSEAVKNLSFAYTTQNSALGNMSGISENFSDIQERGLKILQSQGKLLGKTVGTLDEAGKKQAQYAGMIELTNLTLGSAEKFQGSFADNQDRIAYASEQIQLKLGELINTALKPFQDALLSVLEPLSQNETAMKAVGIALGGIALAITALVIPALLAMVAPVWAVMLPLLPIAGIIAGIGVVIGGLFYLWDTNFLGMKDATTWLANTIQTILQPALQSIQQSWSQIMAVLQPLIAQIWSQLQPALMSIWNVIQPYVVPVLQVLAAILLGPILLAIGAVIGILYGLAAGLNWVASNISGWKDNAVNAFNQFRSGVENVVNQVKAGIDRFVAFIKSAFNIDLYAVGSNIIQGLLNGITNMSGQVMDKAKEIADNIGNTIKGALGIHSPSRVMMEVGVNTVEGLNLGMQSEMPTIQTASQELSNIVTGTFDLATSAGSSNVDNSQSTFNNNVNINAQGANAQQLYAMFKQMLANDMQNQKLGFNRTVNA